MGTGKRLLMNGAMLGLLCSLAVAQQDASSSPMPLDTIVQSMQKAQAGARPQVSYQIIREYRLFHAKNPNADSGVVAEVNFRPPSSKDYRIENSWGSSRGPQLVRRLLDHEVQTTSRTSNILTTENYTFTYIGEAVVDEQPCYLLGLKPKQNGADLLDGQIWVDKSSFRVRRIEGDLEKTPSWWLKRVRIKMGFADLAGMWVQTSMEATADVRIVGTHSLTSRILDYRRESQVAITPLLNHHTAPSNVRSSFR